MTVLQGQHDQRCNLRPPAAGGLQQGGFKFSLDPGDSRGNSNEYKSQERAVCTCVGRCGDGGSAVNRPTSRQGCQAIAVSMLQLIQVSLAEPAWVTSMLAVRHVLRN